MIFSLRTCSKAAKAGLVGVLLTILLTGVGVSAANEVHQDIVVIGTGAIVQGNLARAKDMAVSDALVRGVEQYLSRRLGSEGMMNNFQLLIKDIIPRAREEIENFHILTSEQTDSQYKVLVRVKVNEKLIDEKFRELGLVVMEGPPIRILFMVSQVERTEGKVHCWWQDPEAYSALSATEVALYRAFEERGFAPINRLSGIPESNYSPDMKALDLSYEGARKWGMMFSAQVVMLGRCEIVKAKEASVHLVSLDIKNGVVIDEDFQRQFLDQETESPEQKMEAIEKVISKVASRLSPSIIRAIKSSEEKTSRIEIDINGIKSFREYRSFESFLKEQVEGVKSVRQKRARAGSLTVLVEFSGDEDDFLRMVSQSKSLPLPIRISRADDNRIVFNVEQLQ
ncbi:MAG: hypothetical protein JRF46_13290 [Deltaproteobacteria bacterium]|nr:hypothetical protein [Deltaproteobacteria bacterium]